MARRFTSGEYVFPSEHDPQYYVREEHRYAWLRVLKAIEKLAPEVLKALRKDVLATFKTAAMTAPLPINDVGFLRALSLQPAYPQCWRLQERLTHWADKWHLNEPGFLRRALETLIFWHGNPRKHPGEFCASGPGEPTPFAPNHSVPFNAQGWHPQTEPRDIAKKRIVKELQEQVQRYLDCVEREAQQLGMAQAPTKTQEEHFEWFVRYQVLGRTFTEISREVSLSRWSQEGYKRPSITLAVCSLGTIGRDGSAQRRKVDGLPSE